MAALGRCGRSDSDTRQCVQTWTQTRSWRGPRSGTPQEDATALRNPTGRPDVISYNAVISACTRSDEPQWSPSMITLIRIDPPQPVRFMGWLLLFASGTFPSRQACCMRRACFPTPHVRVFRHGAPLARRAPTLSPSRVRASGGRVLGLETLVFQPGLAVLPAA